MDDDKTRGLIIGVLIGVVVTVAAVIVLLYGNNPYSDASSRVTDSDTECVLYLPHLHANVGAWTHLRLTGWNCELLERSHEKLGIAKDTPMNDYGFTLNQNSNWTWNYSSRHPQGGDK